MLKTGILNPGWLLLLALPALALELPEPDGAAEQTADPVQQRSLEQGTRPQQQPASGRQARPQAKSPVTSGNSPDTFTPTERIEADSAVSFPVDI